MRPRLKVALLVVASALTAGVIADTLYDLLLKRPTRPGDPANWVTHWQGFVVDRLFGFRRVPQ